MNDWVPKRIAVISLQFENVPEAVHFYRDVLGLRLLHHHAMGRPHFDIGGAFLVLLQGSPQPAPRERFPQLALAVDDLDGAMKNLEAHQIPLPWGVKGDDHARWIMFYDPAGNLLELVHFA